MHKFLRLKGLLETVNPNGRLFKLIPEAHDCDECPKCKSTSITEGDTSCTCNSCGYVWEADKNAGGDMTPDDECKTKKMKKESNESMTNESSTVAAIVSGVVLRYGYKVIDQISDASSSILTLNGTLSEDEQSEMMEDVEKVTSSDVEFINASQIRVIG